MISYSFTASEGMPDEARKGTFFRLYEAIFQSPVNKEIEERLSEQPDLFLQIVFVPEGTAVAFKVGYRKSPDTFYSWLGGVLPEHRGNDIGGKLMQQQHDWCRKRGYRFVQTKTLNQWKGMLLLNIKRGFDITGVEAGSSGRLKILMEKTLY